MLKDITITARIDRELGRRLDDLAATAGRSKSWVIHEALTQYVEAEAAFSQAVEQGRRAARAGRPKRRPGP